MTTLCSLQSTAAQRASPHFKTQRGTSVWSFLVQKKAEIKHESHVERWFSLHLRKIHLFAVKPSHKRKSISISSLCIQYRGSSGRCLASWAKLEARRSANFTLPDTTIVFPNSEAISLTVHTDILWREVTYLSKSLVCCRGRHGSAC